MNKFKKIIIIILLALTIIPQAACIKKTDPTPLWDEGFYLDTVCRVTLYATDDELKMSIAKPILDECFNIIKRYEAKLSSTKEGSDIWNINNSNGQPVQCDNATISLLWKAMDYSIMTDGAFDVSIGSVTNIWDFHNIKETPKVPTSAELSRELKHVDYKNISIQGNTVTLLDPDMKLDLGGIAKGYIAEHVGAYLRSRGVTGAVVDLGGNLEIVGYKAGWVPLASQVAENADVDGDGTEDEAGGIAGGTPFVIGIKKPYTETNEIVGTLTAANVSIVTAGVYERYFEVDGKKYHHILSSKTGYPVNSGLISATIVGPPNTASDCDALSTICILLGKDRATEIINILPDYGAILIDEAGEITTLGKLPEFIETEEGSNITEEGIKVD